MRRKKSPKKSLGQHFLNDPNTARKIVEALSAPRDGSVVEIGPGQGALTTHLQENYPELTAIEVDKRLGEALKGTHPSVDVRIQDVLDINWEQLAEEKTAPLFVIGNLPYYITSPIIFSLLEARAVLKEAVLMMQREVAQRLVAEPGTKQYGIPSVLVQLQCTVETLFRVSRHVFYPKPNVESAVVKLTFDRDAGAAEDEQGRGNEAGPASIDFEFLREIVQTAFGQRRKMMRNSLSRWSKDRGITLPHEWGRRRPESLTPLEFVELTRFLERHPEL